MYQQPVEAQTIADVLSARSDTAPVHFFAPDRLDARLAEFRRGFPGLVTYAVKANPTEDVLQRLCAGGLDGFDVASPDEIALIRRICPNAPMHYNNPVRSKAEIAAGIAAGVVSWSVDALSEYEKLVAAGVSPKSEVAVRFKLPVAGAAYDFGAKFGAEVDDAVDLLQHVATSGRPLALTFHVGTQCTDPAAYVTYIHAAAQIAERAGVTLDRLNVGGGFPASRDGSPKPLEPFFAAIREAMSAFAVRPTLICEPGRGLVADSFAYAVQVKSMRGQSVYLTDGIYGGLSEMVSMPAPALAVMSANGGWRDTARQGVRAFGPTCDSLDQLRDPLALPEGLTEGDWIVFRSMGAYVTGVTTRFNGYGLSDPITVKDLCAPYH